ncbi:MAG: primary-amine oxidase [Acidimicrobiia bacterium]|nr:primary-amine oxidase [Acidimicrobiia bacterium]
MHPLEPLSADEIKTAARLVEDGGHLGDQGRFSSITLVEPAKEGMGGGHEGDRSAVALVYDRATGEASSVVVSLTRNAVVSTTAIPGSQPAYLLEEMAECIGLVKSDARWQEALRKRGIEDFDAVQCDPWPAGNFGDPDEQGRRLLRVVSYVRHFAEDNGYAHPIEGVVATVDVGRQEVVRVEDHGVIPVPERCFNYTPDQVRTLRTDLKPLEISQPQGTSFTVDGNEIRWQRWRFRVSMHPLDGLVLHTVAIEDGGELRSILHRAGLGEMVVPYGETSPGHRWKNAFDSGELGLGRFPFLNSLELGCDCLGEIRYLDAVIANDQGDPITINNAICIHEEDYGILWKHFDSHTFTTEVRRSRRLVVSSIHTVGNYEYGFYWYFYLDGTLQLEVKLTGILQTMGVREGDTPVHSTLVAPQLGAPVHQHLFCYRLDFDVDGVANSVYETELSGAPTGADNPYGNALVASSRLLARESEAQRVADPARGRQWRVVNPNRLNVVGQPTGYRLVPHGTPVLLASEEAAVARRAAFATRNLWVTPFSAQEARAAGYPNLSAGGDGLPSFTAGDRSIENTDVVVWYTFGVNHVPRPEDWPVMPVEYAGFTLQPVGFFDQNPALDVAPSNEHCSS